MLTPKPGATMLGVLPTAGLVPGTPVPIWPIATPVTAETGDRCGGAGDELAAQDVLR